MSLHKCVHEEQVTVTMNTRTSKPRTLCFFFSLPSHPFLSPSYLFSPLPFLSSLLPVLALDMINNRREFSLYVHFTVIGGVVSTPIPLPCPSPPPRLPHSAAFTLQSWEIPLWAELWPGKQPFRDSRFQGKPRGTLPANECASTLPNTNNIYVCTHI